MRGRFLPGAFIKAVLERGLQAELVDHLGYDKGDPAGRGSPNSRTGTTSETVQTEVGPVAFDQPRVLGLLQRAGRYRLRRWLFMLGIGAALTFGFGMRVAAVTGAPLDTLMWVASFPLENSPMLRDRVLGAVSCVVLGFPLAGDPWGVVQGMGPLASEPSAERRRLAPASPR